MVHYSCQIAFIMWLWKLANPLQCMHIIRRVHTTKQCKVTKCTQEVHTTKQCTITKQPKTTTHAQPFQATKQTKVVAHMQKNFTQLGNTKLEKTWLWI